MRNDSRCRNDQPSLPRHRAQHGHCGKLVGVAQAKRERDDFGCAMRPLLGKLDIASMVGASQVLTIGNCQNGGMESDHEKSGIAKRFSKVSHAKTLRAVARDALTFLKTRAHLFSATPAMSTHFSAPLFHSSAPPIFATLNGETSCDQTGSADQLAGTPIPPNRFLLTNGSGLSNLRSMRTVPWYTSFRKNISAVIEARGMSQAELSRISGIHVTTISRILNGHMEPTVTTAERLAVAAGITAEKLFSDIPTKSAKEPLTAS